MKDDDSSSIVRSQTAHHVNVSEYTGNATTPQNHVTSDVDRVLDISDADAGPAREITTPTEPSADNSAVAEPNIQALDAAPPELDPRWSVDAEASSPDHHLSHPTETPAPAPNRVDVPVDEFQDELAAIERSRTLDTRQHHVPSESVPDDHRLDLPESALDASAQSGPHDLESVDTDLTQPNRADHHAALSASAHDTHLEAVPFEPEVQEALAGETKPVFTDSHATLPDSAQALRDPELDLAELGHAHPLTDPEPEAQTWVAPTTAPPAAPHSAARPAHMPPHALSPTSAALADPTKDEFQGRLAGIKREVQALNERLTDFEAELDKDGIRPTRP